MIRRSVDLPQPLRPIRQTRSPLVIAKETTSRSGGRPQDRWIQARLRIVMEVTGRTISGGPRRRLGIGRENARRQQAERRQRGCGPTRNHATLGEGWLKDQPDRQVTAWPGGRPAARGTPHVLRTFSVAGVPFFWFVRVSSTSQRYGRPWRPLYLFNTVATCDWVRTEAQPRE